MYFNGYSKLGEEPVLKEEYLDFTLSMEVTPYTYESVFSGLIDNLDTENQKGLRVLIGKGGSINVDLYAGASLVSLSSEGLIKYRKINHVTFSYWGTTGWCDLCINGRLAARKQFARFSRVTLPEKKLCLGRNREISDKRRGFFHGDLKAVKLTDGYTHYMEVLKNQPAAAPMEGKADLYKESLLEGDIYRTKHHLQPPAKWMNEPHAPVYYNGLYHIFYQANPHGPIWDNICWGHLTSKDMVEWKDAGIALDPDDYIEGENFIDPDGCWSGSAGLDLDGSPIIFYTAGNNHFIPNQAVAIAKPKDLTDPELREWIKKGVVIRQPHDKGFLGEFRDPYLFKRCGNYYLLVGSGDAQNGGGNAFVYTSKDLKTFNFLGFLMDYDFEICKESGHVWELPVLLPLNDENGNHVMDILLLCACQVENDCCETYYFLGHFNEATGKFEKVTDRPGLTDLGYGIFTGPSGLKTPDGRSIVFTIAQNHRNMMDEFNAGWAHSGGMPVELSYEKNHLCVRPVREIMNHLEKAEIENPATPQMEGYYCVKSDGGRIDVSFDYGIDAIEVSYSRESGEFKAVRKNDGRMISKLRGDIDKVFISDKTLELEIITDHSLIEIYLNGQKSMSLRCFDYTDGYVVKSETGKVTFRRFING